MPQFDPSSFTSQLFWLAICFGFLYFVMSKIFLPTVRDILKDRHNNINNNRSLALQIQDQVDELDRLSKTIKETSISQYKLSLDQSIKEANLLKEQAISSLKLQIITMVDDSKNKIEQFKQSSQNDRQKTINDLVDIISHKLFH